MPDSFTDSAPVLSGRGADVLARYVSRPMGRRRQTRFTLERIQQIKDLIESGESCEEIAALIGVTIGTLKVTCSKLGISLRRPKLKNGSPCQATQPAMTAEAIFTITMRYNGEERATELPLTSDLIGRMALEASLRNLTISEFAGDLVADVLKKGLLREVLAWDRGPANN